jgi:superfamily II DNA or RNA helicase
MILSNFLWIPKEAVAHLNAIKSKCLVHSKYDKEPIQTCIETEDWVGIPRNFQTIPKGIQDERILPLKHDFEFTGDLRPIQKNMIDDWQLYRNANIDDWIIKADTGVGKTIIMIKIACELKVPFLVIVPLERLMTYWIDQIKKFTTLTDDDIGIVRQDKCEYEGKTACVGLVHSLYKDKYPEEFKDHFGLVIVDECLHPSHDILTDNGWISVKDVTVDHKVAQFNAETKKVTFVNPERVICNDYEGDLVNITGNYYDLLGTMNHEQLVYDYGHKSNKITLGKLDLNKRRLFPVSCDNDPAGNLSFSDRFKIMFQVDGHFLYETKKMQKMVRFSFRKQRKIDRCEYILSNLEKEYKKTYNHRGDCNIWVKIDKNLKLSKSFSWVEFTKGANYYEEFLDELYRWDGWKDKKQEKTTKTRFYENCDYYNSTIVQIVAFLAGKKTKYTKIPKIKPEYSTPHRIRWSDSTHKCIDSRGLKKSYVPYVGKVYCVTVPDGNIVVRRNNKIFITGNCHSTGAKEFSKVLSLFKAKHRCGASATLERQDGMQGVYFHHLGKHIISSEKKTQPKPDIFYYEYKETSGKFPIWLDQYDVIKRRAFLLSMLANNSDRNYIITYFADILINKGIQTLVIGDRISQLEEIQQMLIEKGHENTGLYIGKTPDKEKKRIEKEASCILATKKMLEIGIDIDTLRGIIFATPSSNVTQMVGRTRRINPIMPDPVVIDIIDTHYAEAKRWQASRSKWYQKEGFNTKYIAR